MYQSKRFFIKLIPFLGALALIGCGGARDAGKLRCGQNVTLGP